nr:2Fe-2S iron-sulfur cluster-binding protein [Petrachloros mirabilis]
MGLARDRGNLSILNNGQAIASAGVSAVATPVAPEKPAISREPVTSAPPAAPATVRLAHSGKEIACDASVTLLELAEQEGIDIESSCRSGTCGTCKQKLLSGSIDYAAEPDGLDPTEQEAGWVLTCIAHPQGHVTLEL